MLRGQIKIAVIIFAVLTLLTGIIYPFLITGIAQLFFHSPANGSLIYRNGKVTGSSLIGQPFDDPRYLWGRPSATAPVSCNAAASGGSNLSNTNTALIDIVKARIQTLRLADPGNTKLIPVDLVIASASGLDPHISIAAANYQISRIARQRGLSEDEVKDIILKNTHNRLLGLLGEPTVNVVQVNIELDSWKK
jgi:potassium-transporting ATPase KdpC subunit